MNKLKTDILFILISALFITCLKDSESGAVMETEDSNGRSDTTSASIILKNVSVGPYTLNLILSNKTPFEYDIQIRDHSADQSP